MIRIEELRSQRPAGVLAVGSDPLRLTWRVTSDRPELSQTAYRVEASSEPTFDEILATSGDVESDDQIAVSAPGPALASREVRYLRVHVRTDEGWSVPSPPLRLEAGLLQASDWSAAAITLPGDPGRERQAPSPLLRRSFSVADEVASARLHVTALGVHEVVINGRPVTADLLGPGWTPYGQRLLADTYDVTDLLRSGENVIAATIGDGWYRGRLGWGSDADAGRCRYGREIALVAQLEIEHPDGSRTTIATDEAWRAATGHIRSADFYDGTTIDLREARDGWDDTSFADADWQPVSILRIDLASIEPRTSPPIRRIAVLPVTSKRRPDGSWLLDGGQNIAGFVRLRVRGVAGSEVRIRHAEVLEPDGSLHTLSLRTARATDHFTLADSTEVWLEPRFTFHGFRYADVQTDAEILEAEFVAISSATPRRGTFACSEPALERLHDNVVWSLRDNFVGVPSDCPQRDERLGWTGDAQAFASTAATLVDIDSFFGSWLRDLDLEQDDVLGVPSVVPNVVLDGEPSMGRAGWGDAATIVPMALYESYGDTAILRRQLPSMKRWVTSLIARTEADGLLGQEFQFGDWLDPDAPAHQPWAAKTDGTFLANAFFAYSARLTARTCAILGDVAGASEYADIADRMGEATWTKWREHAIGTQTGCAVAIRLGTAPTAERDAVGSTLAGLVREADGRVATGFLGTPLVLHALTDTGHVDEAYRMLLRREMPSWLYQVDKGATTVWERWDAIRPDGSIHSGSMELPPDIAPPEDGEPHMLSFNHYAYGAVIDWVYRHVAGLAPDSERPGYRSVVFAPRPARGIDHASATIESAYGATAIAWRLEEEGSLRVEVELPFGTTGHFDGPSTASSRMSIDGQLAQGDEVIGPGRHVIELTAPAIANHD